MPPNQREAKIPNTIDRAFDCCSGLTSIEIPDKMNSIRSYAFQNCTGVQSVTIGEGVTSIGACAFSDCRLTSIEIPDKVTTIGNMAFRNCTRLQSVTIGEGVTSIGTFAFEYCNSIQTVYYKGTPSKWKNIWDGGSNNALIDATRYYFSAQTPTAEQWQESENWWHYDGDGITIVLWTKNA